VLSIITVSIIGVVVALSVAGYGVVVPQSSIKDVELFWGKTNFDSCAPVTDQMAFNYYGIYKNQEEIAQYVLQNDPRGYYFFLNEYAQLLGLNFYNLDISINRMEREICSGKIIAVGKIFQLQILDNILSLFILVSQISRGLFIMILQLDQI
jgi:hypothetical protein